MHPHNAVIAEWSFAEHGTHCDLFQTGPDGPKSPLLFSSRAFKVIEQGYFEWGKGLLSLVQVVKQPEKTHQEQPVQIRGAFNLLESILKHLLPQKELHKNPPSGNSMSI